MPGLFFTLVVLVGCGGSPAPQPAPTIPTPERAGSRSCATCHPAESKAWTGSHHHLAQRGPSALKPEQLPADQHVVGYLGVAPLIQPLFPYQGRIQASDRAWDTEKLAWFDVFPDDRNPGEWGHWTGGGMTWNSQCATCHNTSVRIGFDAATDAYNTEIAERGVGCEACHGPAGDHRHNQAPMPKIQSDADHCAPCHSRRLAHADGAPEGAALLDHFTPALPDLSDAYWPDGQVRDENFEWVSFAGSAKGVSQVSCSDCHDPHSGGLLLVGDALCESCHGDTSAHDHHDSAVSCVDCHMPQTVYMQRHARRDHSFSSPNPQLTIDMGIPNACNRCHQDRDAAWSLDAMTRWNQVPPPNLRAIALHAARQSQPTAAISLLTALDAEKHPQWRASLVRSMGPSAADAKVMQAIGLASVDTDAQVRAAAATALPEAHPKRIALATDAVRAVRIAAQRGLMAQRPPNDPLMADLRALLDSQQDQPPQALDLANWQVAHGDQRGLQGLQSALNRWPNEPSIHHQLAVALAMSGDQAAARAVLEAAVGTHANDAALWDALAKVRAPDGDTKGAIYALERSVSLDSGRARSWYNLSILRAQSAEPNGAAKALAHCIAINPALCQD